MFRLLIRHIALSAIAPGVRARATRARHPREGFSAATNFAWASANDTSSPMVLRVFPFSATFSNSFEQISR